MNKCFQAYKKRKQYKTFKKMGDIQMVQTEHYLYHKHNSFKSMFFIN